jgi:histidyl-tRNA synthetase
MRDFLPADVRKRNYVINIIKEVYESYGFEPLETPAVENIETLLGKYGEEGNQLVFKILKRGEKLDLEKATKESDLSDLALRYDLTVPLARVVANNKNELPKFFRRYQIQPVWRADRPARGRFREFYQCDVDAIGSSSMVVEADLIVAIVTILKKLGFEDFVIRVNHREILTCVLQALRVPFEKHGAALIAIDKLDKIGLDGVRSELIKIGIEEDAAEEFMLFQKAMKETSDEMRISSNLAVAERTDEGDISEIDRIGVRMISNSLYLHSAKDFFRDHGILSKGVEQLFELIRLVDSSDFNSHVVVDLSLARGLSYYTGTILEINVPDLSGSLGGGGRYDGLIGMFGKEQIPACGFSLGLERILVVMEEREMFPPEIAESTPADVLVTIWNEESIADSLKLAAALRKQDLRVTVYPEADKLGKQFKYADSISVPFVCVLGDEEKSSGNVKLKNMTTGDERTLPIEEIGNAIRNQAH